MKPKFKHCILIFFVLTIACSPAQRIERITRRNPQLLERKTIIARDTLIYPGLNFFRPIIIRDHDTVRDTVGNTEFEYIRNIDTLYIKVKSKPDTITVEIPIEVDAVRVYESKHEIPLWSKLMFLPLVLHILYRFITWIGRKMDNSEAKR